MSNTPDSGIKKVIIPRSSLPPVGKDGKYLVRYRIVSTDRNRYSHWSPIYNISGKTVETVTGSVQKVGNIIMVAWNMVSDIPSYDIFIKYDSETNYTYHGSTSSNNYSIISQGTTTANVAVQIGGIIKEQNNANTIYTGTISLV